MQRTRGFSGHAPPTPAKPTVTHVCICKSIIHPDGYPFLFQLHKLWFRWGGRRLRHCVRFLSFATFSVYIFYHDLYCNLTFSGYERNVPFYCVVPALLVVSKRHDHLLIFSSINRSITGRFHSLFA